MLSSLMLLSPAVGKPVCVTLLAASPGDGEAADRVQLEVRAIDHDVVEVALNRQALLAAEVNGREAQFAEA